jgi:hypothetical protein
MKNYSNLQKDILKFYRQCVRFAYTRGEVYIIILKNRNEFLDYFRDEFKRNQNVKKTNFDRVCVNFKD